MKTILTSFAMALLPLCAIAQVGASGAGATFPSVVYKAWANKYESTFGKPVSYTPTGSGDGIKKIIAREVAFGGTDTPLSESELTKNRLVQLPVLVGGVVPVVNVKGIAANDLRLTGEVLADVFRGDIRTWNDKRIQALNPGIALPATAITRVVRSEKSGTTEGFTKYLAQVSPDFKKEIGVSALPSWGKSGTSLQAVEGSDGIAKAVRETPGSIGYLSFDRAIKNSLSAVRLRAGDGAAFVTASEDGFKAAVKASDMGRLGDETASLLNTPAANAWPITLASFILVDAQPKTATSVATAMHFLYWTQLTGDGMLRNTGFAPLPVDVQARFAARLLKIQAQDGKPIPLM